MEKTIKKTAKTLNLIFRFAVSMPNLSSTNWFA
jgi:hypothetical protein